MVKGLGFRVNRVYIAGILGGDYDRGYHGGYFFKSLLLMVGTAYPFLAKQLSASEMMNSFFKDIKISTQKDGEQHRCTSNTCSEHMGLINIYTHFPQFSRTV